MNDNAAGATWPPKGFPFYAGPQGPNSVLPRPSAPVLVESMPRRNLEHPGKYRPHPDLEAAVNTALLLGMPLLVTGEPGCGKTQLGEALAYALGLRHEKFETKSSSQARDLFYIYDIVGRFQAKDVSRGEPEADPRYFIEYRALGKAILFAYKRKEVEHLLPVGPQAFQHADHPERSVVIIDEIDKAPRDFPNDILNEIDRMYFRVPELGAEGIKGTPAADDSTRDMPPHLRPIVVLTSNSEKKLPDAFLRRCAYFHIPDPEGQHLRDIIFGRLEEYLKPGQPLVEDCLAFFAYLRDPRRGLAKRPGVAELLNWLQALVGHNADQSRRLADQRSLVQRTFTTLFKTSEDLARGRFDERTANDLLGQWAQDA